MTKHDPWFFEERAFAFASLVLTKRNDVKVQPYAGPDRAIHLLAEVMKGGKSTLRFFGVQVIPYLDLPPIQNANDKVLSHLPRDPERASLPLCVFVIGVRKPEGIYRWAVEPIVEDGRAILRRDEAANWQPLDEAGADRLIDQVNIWYGAFNGDPTSSKRARRSKTGS